MRRNQSPARPLAKLSLQTTRLHVSPTELGLVLGAGAVGGLIGAAVTTPLTRLVGVGPAFVLSCVVFPAPLLLVPLAAGSPPPRSRWPPNNMPTTPANRPFWTV